MRNIGPYDLPGINHMHFLLGNVNTKTVLFILQIAGISYFWLSHMKPVDSASSTI